MSQKILCQTCLKIRIHGCIQSGNRQKNGRSPFQTCQKIHCQTCQTCQKIQIRSLNSKIGKRVGTYDTLVRGLMRSERVQDDNLIVQRTISIMASLTSLSRFATALAWLGRIVDTINVAIGIILARALGALAALTWFTSTSTRSAWSRCNWDFSRHDLSTSHGLFWNKR